MDVKEKLVELIKDGIRKGLRAKGDDRLDYSFEDVADHLINNGVTVHEFDGCDFCQKFDFAGARAEVNKYGAHISLAIYNTKFPNDEQFKFCPMCGRRLPQPTKGE